MSNVGFATIDVVPDLSGFARKLSRGVKGALGVGGLGAAFGIGSFIKSSVDLEATYSRTMGQMRVATQSSAKEMQRLDDLAIDLGKKTVFSANDASSAMLELAKNGISPAVIEAGALSSALTLAAAGSTDLTFAAQTMGNAINAFGLKGKDSASVAAALAGAANASSASVESLAQGLQQAATGANDAGLNVQETTGILAAFANAGISGSDAGTSLKTMLSRLVPSTKKARDAMKKFGLDFTDANGEFLSATEIAKELKTGLGGLSSEERSLALNTIFGSDARRAATVLTKEGAAGLQKYIDATSDQSAAEKLAKANMEGTAGAMERLKGTWETARLEFGKAIAPTVQKFLDFISSKIDDVSPKLTEFGDWFTKTGAPAIADFADEMRPLANDLLPAAANAFKDVKGFAEDALPFAEGIVRAFNGMPGWVKKVLVGGAAGGLAANKLGLTKAIGGNLFSKGSTPANPLNVFVVNQGVGAGTGGAGSTRRGGRRGSTALDLGVLFGLPLLANGGASLLNKTLGGKEATPDDRSREDKFIDRWGQTTREAIEDAFGGLAKTLGEKRGGTLPGGRGVNIPFVNIPGVDFFSNTEGVKDALSKLTGAELDKLNSQLKETFGVGLPALARAGYVDAATIAKFQLGRQITALQAFEGVAKDAFPSDRKTRFTILGLDTAKDDLNDIIALMGQIRATHVENQINRLDPAAPPPPKPKPDAPSDRGIHITVEKVEAQNVNTLLTDLQRRAHRASSDGVRR